MTPYKSFASFYDQVMGPRERHIAKLVLLLSKHAPQGRTILELGCGTGTVLRALKARYTVSGLDLSPEMIAVAKKKIGPDRGAQIRFDV